ncbi:hypothetical protein [Winogradskyella haliclonae]|uniref:Uncharacterized protein n=1 Tax=Winogradskyella haliclonae TaxID=2048558 RepID=A0ABQ2C5V4_9FLAO|nr:hypothetical protein [Winogradskyella haliclonae]GGI58478.1 hypothetical protein GCM10011444_27870 [Winogradskyella haliclonae]
MSDFKQNYLDEIDELKNNLYTELDITDSSSVLEYQFEVIHNEIKKNGIDLRDNLHQLRLQYLLHNLKVIKSGSNADTADMLIKDLRQAKDDDKSFYGFRFEIYIARRFVRDKVIFEKSESPDFNISDFGNTTVECSGLHSRGGTKTVERFEKKVIEKIKEKEAKPYANLECALFLDVTNLLFSLDDTDDWQVLLDNLNGAIEEYMASDKFGSILVFALVYSQKQRNIRYVFNRIDSKNIHQDLMRFLETHFPENGSSVKGPAVPREA